MMTGLGRHFAVRVLLVVVLLALTSFVAMWLRSREPVPATASPLAAPSRITAEVESRVLKRTLHFRADIEADGSAAFTPAGLGAPTVVTDVLVTAGDTVDSGSVILVLGGRPVIALEGRLPMYRDIEPYAEGPDVRQLQSTLAELGLFRGDVDGVFGPVTQDAVAAMYARSGYEPSKTAEGRSGSLEDAEDELRAARREADLLAAELAALRQVPVTADPATDPGGADQVAPAPGLEEQRRLELRRLEASVEAARDAVAAAQRRVASLRRESGLIVPRDELFFVPSTPGVVADLHAKVGEVEPGEALLSVSTGELAAAAMLDLTQSSALSVGDAATLVDETTGDSYSAAVRYVDDSSSEGGYRVIVEPLERLPNAMIHRNVLVTVDTDVTREAVLSVPLPAVASDSSGQPYLTLVRDSGDERVPVEVGFVADGHAEIRSASTTLRPGDLVLIGVDNVYGGE